MTTPRQTLLLALAALLTGGAAQAHAASVTITGPPSAVAGDRYTAAVAVDPANDAGNALPVVTVKVVDGTTCPAGPGASSAPELFSTQLDATGGPKTGQAFVSPAKAGTVTFCGWLSDTSIAQTAYAVGTLTVPVKAAVPFRERPAVTAAWGQTAARACRVTGEVTPGGTGKVSLQRRVGRAWRTVKSVAIRGTKYTTTFSARNGQTYRISYAGNARLLAGTSLSHRISKRTKYSC